MEAVEIPTSILTTHQKRLLLLIDPYPEDNPYRINPRRCRPSGFQSCLYRL